MRNLHGSYSQENTGEREKGSFGIVMTNYEPECSIDYSGSSE